MMTHESLLISTRTLLSFRVILVIFWSSVFSVWVPAVRLESSGLSVTTQDYFTHSSTEVYAISSDNDTRHVNYSHTFEPLAVSESAVLLPNASETRQADEETNNSVHDNATLPYTWIPPDSWLQQCVQREENNPKNYKKKYRSRWPHYQLGDCLKICKSCPSSLQKSEVKELSIVGHYWKRVCHKKAFSEKFNAEFLSQLFEKFEANPHPYSEPWPQPASDELVIHLRIGDVIDEPQYSGNTSVFDMLRYGADTRHGVNSFYHKGIKSVEEYLSTIRESGLKKVVLRGGSHFPKVYPKSRIYTKCLTEAIQHAGYAITSVQVDGEDNPDQDFFYMSHARHFVQATGGYSRLIAHMVKHYGGTILGRVPGAHS